MEIKLKGNYIITADSMTYMLSKWKMSEDNKGELKMRLTATTFHSTLENTLRAYKEKSVKNSNCTTIEEILILVKDLDQYIREVLKDN